MEITDKDRRRLLKAHWAEMRRVDALLRRGVLPSWPEYPNECVGMICGGIGRRSGLPCKSKEIYENGRCKWHGGQSTGPKTAEGKARSQGNLRRGSKL
jgi:hypothetical protein